MKIVKFLNDAVLCDFADVYGFLPAPENVGAKPVMDGIIIKKHPVNGRGYFFQRCL